MVTCVTPGSTLKKRTLCIQNVFILVLRDRQHLFPWIHWLTSFRRVLALRKATISLVMSVCPSVHPHGTPRIPLAGFAWNLILKYFSKICREKIKFYQNITRIAGTWHEAHCTFITKYRSILLGIKNVLDKKVQKIKTQNFYWVIIFFPKIVLFMKLCGKILYSPTGHR